MKTSDVAVLGATGTIGQQFVKLLENHPWFTLVAVTSSPEKVGNPLGSLKLLSSKETSLAPIVFSAIKGEHAFEIEQLHASSGSTVISCSRANRMEPLVPLLIPEVNAEHLQLNSPIITKPNCSVTGIALALKPLHDLFGIEKLNIHTQQALSGAGKGISSIDYEDNVIPYIADEELRHEIEIPKVLGAFQNMGIIPANISISVTTTRVPITDGHLASLSITFKNKPTRQQILDAWENFQPLRGRNLPSAPIKPLLYLHDSDQPQTKLWRDRDQGMGVTIGRLRECPHYDYKCIVLSHNTLRGGAKGAILAAELLKYSQGSKK